jgi:hypothetical protein
MTDYPFRQYTTFELLEEFKKLQEYIPTGKLTRRRLGYKCSNAFFQYERMNTPSKSNLSNIEFWKKFKQKILQYNLKEERDLFHTIQFMNHPPSQFPPTVALELYAKFKASIVLDPFAGWGDRCIAAMAKNIGYVGIDSNLKLKIPYKEMIKFYPHYSKVRFINKPVEKVDISKLDFDFVLTSPPFWDEHNSLIEHYSNMTCTNMYDFMENIFIPVLIRSRKIAKWSCYYIPTHMAKYLAKFGICWDKKIQYTSMGNKKYQDYAIYCFKQK